MWLARYFLLTIIHFNLNFKFGFIGSFFDTVISIEVFLVFLSDNAIDAGGCVLVHCLGGVSRSSTIVIAYLMIKYGFSLEEAYDHVKSKKRNIAPNFSFMGQLMDLEQNKCLATAYTGNMSPAGSDISNSSFDPDNSS